MRIRKGDGIVDTDYSTIVIAEVSANHCKDKKRAFEMIRVAKECDADMVKFQAYDPDTMTIDCDKEEFMVEHPHWGGQTLYELYKKAYTPLDWLPELKTCCDDTGIEFLCTAYDKRGIDLLDDLGVAICKVASFELVDIPFLEHVADTDMDVIMSIGMGNICEVAEAVQVFDELQLGELALLKCVSSYPADPSGMHLKTLPNMRELFGWIVGLSDHTPGIGVSIAAVALGADIIEKHFTLSRKNNKSPDSFFSIEPDELKMLTSQVKAARESLGSVCYGLMYEDTMRAFRRSLFVVEDIKKGQELTIQNIRSIRPSNGMAPKYLPTVLGRKAKEDMERGTPLAWDLIV